MHKKAIELTNHQFHNQLDLVLDDGAFLLPQGRVRDLFSKYRQEMRKLNDTSKHSQTTTVGACLLSSLISGRIFGIEEAIGLLESNQHIDRNDILRLLKLKIGK